jgi:hypothetical protein
MSDKLEVISSYCPDNLSRLHYGNVDLLEKENWWTYYGHIMSDNL